MVAVHLHTGAVPNKFPRSSGAIGVAHVFEKFVVQIKFE